MDTGVEGGLGGGFFHISMIFVDNKGLKDYPHVQKRVKIVSKPCGDMPKVCLRILGYLPPCVKNDTRLLFA